MARVCGWCVCGAATGIVLAALTGYVLLVHCPSERLINFLFQKAGQQ